jgi:hypothetical protein
MQGGLEVWGHRGPCNRFRKYDSCGSTIAVVLELPVSLAGVCLAGSA